MEYATPVSFSLAQRILHWATAVLVFFNLIFSDSIEEWHHAMRRSGGATAEQVSAANIHAYVGIAILILVILRLIVRFTTGVPASPPEEPAIFRLGAKIAHAGLYILLLAMPFTGIAAYYFGSGPAGDIHADVFKVLLWILIVAHIVGALVHHFYWKTDVLKRMTSGVR